MHRTRSVDYAVVLSGEIDMMLDDSVGHLKPGDTIVQQATNHAWVGHGTDTCRMLFVLMDSTHPLKPEGAVFRGGRGLSAVTNWTGTRFSVFYGPRSAYICAL